MDLENESGKFKRKKASYTGRMGTKLRYTSTFVEVGTSSVALASPEIWEANMLQWRWFHQEKAR